MALNRNGSSPPWLVGVHRARVPASNIWKRGAIQFVQKSNVDCMFELNKLIQFDRTNWLMVCKKKTNATYSFIIFNSARHTGERNISYWLLKQSHTVDEREREKQKKTVSDRCVYTYSIYIHTFMKYMGCCCCAFDTCAKQVSWGWHGNYPSYCMFCVVVVVAGSLVPAIAYSVDIADEQMCGNN